MDGTGLGRSKFLPKPLPQEINMLLSECDIGCYSDTSDKSSAPAASIATATMDAKSDSTLPTNVFGCVDSRHANNLDTSLDDDEEDDTRVGWVKKTVTSFNDIRHALVYHLGRIDRCKHYSANNWQFSNKIRKLLTVEIDQLLCVWKSNIQNHRPALFPLHSPPFTWLQIGCGKQQQKMQHRNSIPFRSTWIKAFVLIS